MKIWELLPIDPANENWAASTRGGRVVIRAESEDRAREIASTKFRSAATKSGSAPVPYPPWMHPDLVECRELTDGSFDAEGDEAVLKPADYYRDWPG